ncbi:SUMF1/EgtB/PvdO family nonheme iron enzyme [Actinoallomurus spadix]|uniref:Formylglycine-generating enzyme family protein n=1 Tax=Actinoallomurus spadix TaxID=79912 RepID=A0ABN0WM09_9ACTN|nr:SUMF1/EgtB/PvdO family nonheme iron enzyme [Actinoallomurus spadix]MCO5984537.1 SUMF1/EgtB/PvdO family nonheme iron enzyme [Actinoallomurus spadix]
MRRLIGELRHPRAVEELCAVAATHPSALVRRSVLEGVEPFLATHPAARELLVWLLGDDEDFVVFTAAKMASRNRIGEAYEELEHITGPANTALFHSTKPVGIGAAVVATAMGRILGADDRAERMECERVYAETGRLPAEAALGEHWDYEPEHLPKPAPEGMVLVPGSSFVTGVGMEDVVHPIYEVDDAVPRRTRHLPDFLIDRYPVTNREYDAWAGGDAAREHVLCHPDEPEGKDHRRGLASDPRFGPDHPAVGVDWFDAYAYLAHHGKRLPTELEWEKAARGENGAHYPWGREFDPAALRWFGAVFGEPASLEHWRDTLCTFDDTTPAVTTVPVGSYPKNVSAYGVADLVGNCWEWTDTNFYTRDRMRPMTSGRPRPEWATAEESFAVIRGGAWTSMAEELTAYFRGKDLLTDRHNEIGFRGVIR